MAKKPFQMRIEPDLLDDIRKQAKMDKRSVNNMAEVLLSYGLEYLTQRESRILSTGVEIGEGSH